MVVNVHKTDNDFANGTIEASPRFRINRSASLTLSTTWQRIDMNGTSGNNLNGFPFINGVDGQKVIDWDATNKLIKFGNNVDRNYSYTLFLHCSATGLLTDNNVQFRFVIPNGLGAGNNYYFPFPEDGGLIDIMAVGAMSDKRFQDSSIIYANQMIRDNGMGLEIKLKSTPIIQTVTLSSAAFLLFGP